MNTVVLIPLILCIVQASAVDKQEAKAKPTSSPVNTIQQNLKYEMVYQPVRYQQPLQQQQIQLQPVHQIQQLQHLQQLQQRPQYIPIQLISKPYYVQQPQAQPQAHAMIIIAQPALLPHNLVYGNPTQQLLNYFHSNPQARYQLLHGHYQPQAQQIQQPQQQQVQPTATYMHPVLASPATNYILTSAPQPQAQQLVAHTTPIPAQQTVQYTQQSQPTQQLTSLAQLAQLAAQQYASTPMKSAPAIITGFEQFTPEQQAQIKAQLSSTLGGGFHAVTNAAQNQYSSKYVSEQDNSNFVPSPQVQSEPVTTISSQTAELLKTRYTKGKN